MILEESYEEYVKYISKSFYFHLDFFYNIDVLALLCDKINLFRLQYVNSSSRKKRINDYNIRLCIYLLQMTVIFHHSL